MRLPVSRKKQAGFVMALSFGILALIIVLIYTSVGKEIAMRARLGAEDVRKEWLLESVDKIALWYEREKATIDASTDAIDKTAALNGAGVVPKYSMQFASTERIDGDAVKYHVIALWLPEDGAVDTGLSDRGIFSPGTIDGVPAKTIYGIVNGEVIQTQAMRNSLAKLETISKRLSNWFRVQKEQARTEEQNFANFFRIGSCSASAENYLPCVDAFTAFTSLADIRSRLGMVENDFQTSWGGAVLFSNAEGIPSGSKTIGLRFITPWNKAITTYISMD